MKVLIAGMTPQSSSAMELIVRSVFADAAVLHNDRRASNELSKLRTLANQCDLCVVDLLGFGWTQWSAQRESDLQENLIGKRRAIVLVPPGDSGGWIDAFKVSTLASRPLTLQHPASMTLMRDALQRLRDEAHPVIATALAATRDRLAQVLGRAPRPDAARRQAGAAPDVPAPPAPPAPPQPSLRARLRAAAGAKPAAATVDDGRSDPPTVPNFRAGVEVRVFDRSAAKPAKRRTGLRPAPPAEVPFGLSAAAHAELATICPAVAAHPFLSLVFNVALRDTPHEFRIGKHAAAVFVPGRNWVSSNVSTAMRKRLTQHPVMLQIAEVRALSEAEAENEAKTLFGRRDDGRRPLDAFIWALVFHTFEDEPIELVGALEFQLEHFPNFTRLPAVPDLFLQLALVSLRQPQSVIALQRSFARHDARLVTLFALCAVLSGAARLLPRTALPAAVSPPPPPRGPLLKRGFLKSLLAKLF